MFTRKYRPSTFAEFIGHSSSIKALLSAYPEWPSTFLLCGPPGLGKTSLARLIAKQLGTIDINIREVDAGQDRGIDKIREIISSAYNRPLIGRSKVFIVDEAQGLTNDAQQALLKVTEESPQDTYFIFCSTNPSKIIKALKERCRQGTINLLPLSNKEIGVILKNICEKEGIKLEGKTRDIAILCVENSEGIPRNAIMSFEKFYRYDDLESVKRELDQSGENIPDEWWPMVNALEKGDIKEFLVLYSKNIDSHFEGYRITMAHIFKKKVLKAMIDQSPQSVHLSKVLQVFATPVDDIQGEAELIYRFSKL